MSAVSEYVGNIKEAVTSIFEGMAVTASHFMRKPYTVQYPDRMPVRVQDTLPFRYRGILEVDLEICTGCLACERACPIDCIVIVVDKDPQIAPILNRGMTYLDQWAQPGGEKPAEEEPA
jgi:formate hydrogenlyase subunit 6/NADH:ubiquinone oxidoreductase subunit I